MTSTANLTLKMLGVTLLLGSLALGMSGCGGGDKPAPTPAPTDAPAKKAPKDKEEGAIVKPATNVAFVRTTIYTA